MNVVRKPARASSRKSSPVGSRPGARGLDGLADAEKQLQGFIDKFEPKHRTLIREARKLLQQRFPTANELVYDNYNFFVIGYSPTERPSDTIVSLVGGANGIGVAFYRGADLPDPHHLLLGAGKQNRFIRLPSPHTLSQPEVESLIAAAVAQANAPLPLAGRGKLIIRAISAKQRPRRKIAQ